MNEWIDAKQHKPSTVDAGAKHSGNVLTFGPKGIAVGFYHAGMKAWINARGGTMSVTHWMAPPEFPAAPAGPCRHDDARAEDGAFAQVAAEQGPFRPRTPSQDPEARMARLERKLTKLAGRLDDMEACAVGARKRAADVADRMAAANGVLARWFEDAMTRIAVLEAGRAFPPPAWAPGTPYPGTTPIVTCGPDGR